jgi:Mg2+ and Co2+ transporter CorA
VIVLSRQRTTLWSAVEQRLTELDPAVPTLVRATYALLNEILSAYERVVASLETSLVGIETEQALLRDRPFLEQTFQLRSEISRVRGNLKHLKDVIHGLSQKRLAIWGFEESHRPLFVLLADDAEDLYEGVDDLREGLAALVDLRLNVSSFQMNKVMRLLALLTTLALIPSVAGGLLGMNLAGSPWPVTLSQIAFGMAAGMALSLYVFAIKGWLR